MIELTQRQIAFKRQIELPLLYKGQPPGGKHRLDLIVENQRVLELKATGGIAPIHEATALSYLKATQLSLALIINFNTPILKDGIKRIIRSSP